MTSTVFSNAVIYFFIYRKKAPSAEKVPSEMIAFLDWFNKSQNINPVLKAAFRIHGLLHSMAQTDDTIAATSKRAQFLETHRATAFNPRQQKILQLLLDDFFGKLTVSIYTKITKVSTDTSLKDIQDLMAKGILTQEGSGRSTSYTPVAF